MHIASREKYIFHMLFGAFHITPSISMVVGLSNFRTWLPLRWHKKPSKDLLSRESKCMTFWDGSTKNCLETTHFQA